MDPGSCVPNCPKKYRTSNMTSLYRHQTSCKAYLAYQAEGNQLRAERISRKAEEEVSRPSKRARIGERLASRLQGSSSTSRRGHGVRANQPVQPQGDAGTSGDGHVGASRGSQSVHWPTTSPLPSGSSMDMAMPAGASEDPLYDATPFDATNTRSPEPLSPPNIGDSTTPGSPPPAPEPLLDQPPRRSHRRPQQVDDYLPEPLPALEEAGQSHSVVRRIRLIVRDTLRTAANSLGLSRSYRTRPTFDPDSFVLPEDLAKTSPLYNLVDSRAEKNDKTYTLKNKSQAALSTWQHSGSTQKSNEEVQKLVDVLLDPDFKLAELKGFNARRVAEEMDRLADANPSILDQFKTTSVSIKVPSGSPEDIKPPRTFSIPGLHHRSILSLIKSAFAHPLAAQFHLTPYTLYHTPPNSEDKHGKGTGTATEGETLVDDTQRVYSELYDSDMFIQEHEKVQNAPTDDPTCKRKKIVAALMFWSDSTHLANFGTAKLWPVYMFLRNLSKYVRSMPNSGACQHLAYIPALPDYLTAELTEWHTNPKHIPEVLTHCHRELMHGVWKILLDDELIHAMTYGIVIKVLLATVRDKGTCLCPRCLVTKSKADQMGTGPDMTTRSKVRKYLGESVRHAREWIYRFGKGLKSKAVEDHLKESSSVPTENAFVVRIGPDFDLARMMVPDFMHEFELGVWKLLFTHLVRVLHAASPGGALVAQLDQRFRAVGTFGNSTIRKFASNASEMKKLAARDFEDLLQCAIPAFDGLLEDVRHSEALGRDLYPNRELLTLLYRTAEFHSFAKMRLHTDRTLEHLEKVTAQFGRLIRRFRDEVCPLYNTYELPSEADHRARRQIREQNARRAEQTESAPANSRLKGGRKLKTLNLATYKFHSLGDYVKFIRLFGGSDSFSTQIGELAHRLVKRLYGLTNKRSVAQQIGRRVRRVERAQAAAMRNVQKARLRHVVHRVSRKARKASKSVKHVTEELESMFAWDRDARFNISVSQNLSINLTVLLSENGEDPAFENFLPKLQDHLLGRRIGREFDGDNHDEFTHEDRNTIRILKLFEVGTCHVNFTTYDNRRDYDVVNPRRHADIMVYSREDDPTAHPFWYARVIKIYHAKVSCSHPRALSRGVETMSFMLVRWFGSEPGYRSGFRGARLPKVGFVEYNPNHDNFAFGFLDPKQIIRGCHLIPNFKSGSGLNLLPFHQTAARQQEPYTEDWTSYYVNIFVDRDMIMRHYGGAVGHLAPSRPIENPITPVEGGSLDSGEQHPHTPNGVEQEEGAEEEDSSGDDSEDSEGEGNGESSEDSEDDGDDGHYASD